MPIGKEFRVKNKVKVILSSLIVLVIGSVAFAGKTTAPKTDIVEAAANSKDHTTLVAALKAASLVETLKGAGPFTVFAPTDTAFKKLPAGTLDGLLKAEAKATLTKILTYHVVAGKIDAAKVVEMIKEGKGKATAKTVAGGVLTFSLEGKSVVVADEKGGSAKVIAADLMQKNGVIHSVDSVLMPN